MEKFTKLTGIAAPLPLINVDTDMIIPKQFLKTILRTGLGWVLRVGSWSLMIWLLARVVFTRGWLTLPDWPRIPEQQLVPQAVVADRGVTGELSFNRAEQVSNAVENIIRREQNQSSDRFIRTPLSGMSEGSSGPAAIGPTGEGSAPRLGSSYRRASLRSSRAGQARDRS